jgi:arginine-glutamic acid dipeptide repeat-containing protein
MTFQRSNLFPLLLPLGEVPISKRPEPWGEELSWSPSRIHDHDLLMFLRAARSMAAFASMCDGGSPEEGFTAASRDGITAEAIQKLHECDYDTGKALQALLKVPFPDHDVFRRWPEEDIRNFIKGDVKTAADFFLRRNLSPKDHPLFNLSFMFGI